MPQARAVKAEPPSCPESEPSGAGAPTIAAAPGYRLPLSELDETEAIRQYMPMVKRLASHLGGRLPDAVQLDDLIQAGLIAVLRVMRQGEATRLGDAALRRTITNAMIDEARRETWAPVRTVRLAKAAADAMRAIKRRLGRDGSDDEIAAEMGIALGEFQRVLLEIAGIRLLQLDEFDESGERQLQIAGGQEAGLHRRRVVAALVESIASLPERERLVVSLYYEHELNMEEVGKVSPKDASQTTDGGSCLAQLSGRNPGTAQDAGRWLRSPGERQSWRLRTHQTRAMRPQLYIMRIIGTWGSDRKRGILHALSRLTEDVESHSSCRRRPCSPRHVSSQAPQAMRCPASGISAVMLR